MPGPARGPLGLGPSLGLGLGLGLRAAALQRALAMLALALALAAALLHPAARAWDAQRMREAARQLGPAAEAEAVALQQLLRSLAREDELHRLVTVNRYFNTRIQFRSDWEIWGQEDHWASPLQTLSTGRGDCEDFVIAKYATLLSAGLPLDRLRLVYVRARLPDQAAPLAHMVLAYYPSPTAEPLILDNLRPEVLPAGQRPDLTPVFSFNSAGLWQGAGPQSAGDPMARLSRWRDAWQRTRLEGFP